MGIKIGSGWTKNTQQGNTFISYSLTKEALILYPQLKDLNIMSFHVPEASRKNENSPHWDLIISEKQERKEVSEEEMQM